MKNVNYPVNVRLQSISHVQPICEFTANDSRENMRAAIFHKGSPCKADMEDVLHRRCTLLKSTAGIEMDVASMVNTSKRHHRSKPMTLTNEYELCDYVPAGAELVEGDKSFDKRVARVDFSFFNRYTVDV